jgi:hypothetical protein
MRRARERVSAQDRDRALESKYKPCVDGCCRSLLQRIGYHSEELVDAYFRWASAERVERYLDNDKLLEWERAYFGDDPYFAAHGRMMALIKERLFAKKSVGQEAR